MKAYYTVELALLMPALLFVLYMPVYLGFELYTVTKQVSASGWEASFDAVGYVRAIKFVEDIWEEQI